jgi:hypothetical protein
MVTTSSDTSTTTTTTTTTTTDAHVPIATTTDAPITTTTTVTTTTTTTTANAGLLGIVLNNAVGTPIKTTSHITIPDSESVHNITPTTSTKTDATPTIESSSLDNPVDYMEIINLDHILNMLIYNLVLYIYSYRQNIFKDNLQTYDDLYFNVIKKHLSELMILPNFGRGLQDKLTLGNFEYITIERPPPKWEDRTPDQMKFLARLYEFLNVLEIEKRTIILLSFFHGIDLMGEFKKNYNVKDLTESRNFENQMKPFGIYDIWTQPIEFEDAATLSILTTDSPGTTNPTPAKKKDFTWIEKVQFYFGLVVHVPYDSIGPNGLNPPLSKSFNSPLYFGNKERSEEYKRKTRNAYRKTDYELKKFDSVERIKKRYVLWFQHRFKENPNRSNSTVKIFQNIFTMTSSMILCGLDDLNRDGTVMGVKAETTMDVHRTFFTNLFGKMRLFIADFSFIDYKAAISVWRKQKGKSNSRNSEELRQQLNELNVKFFESQDFFSRDEPSTILNKE